MGLLVHSGAVAINQELEAGRVIGLSFVMPIGAGQLPFKLPVRTDCVFKKLNDRRPESSWDRRKKTRKQGAEEDKEQAERIAWRQLYWWLKSQFALIDLGMVETAEVLMPYMLAKDGRSFFDTYKPRLLDAPKGDAA